MKFPLFAAVLAGCLMLHGVSASAEESDSREFFVEIGEDVAKENVEKEWQSLRSKYKAQLGKLKLYPKDVIKDGELVATRMQAGPIPLKTAAQKICNKLFAADVPCFVIEGVANLPPTARVNLNDRATKLSNAEGTPWQAKPTEVGAAPPVKEESFFTLPWLTDDSDKQADAQPLEPKATESAPVVKAERKRPQENVEQLAEAKQDSPKKRDESKAEAAKTDKRQASVQVAEAIRVPLSDDRRLPSSGGISISSLPDLMPSAGGDNEDIEKGSKETGAGRLLVSSFLNEEVAISLWDEVRSANPKRSKSLDFIVEPTKASKGQTQAMLSVGPFAHSEEAFEFCREGLQAKDRGLTCRFQPNDSGIANNKTLTLDSTRSESYNARRGAQPSSRRRPTQNPPSELSPAAGPSNQYWVQVVSAKSQMEALKRWEVVKTENQELIGGLRSNVSAATNDNTLFVVRVGPIANNDEAIRVCSQLQRRNVECRVLLYSNNGRI